MIDVLIRRGNLDTGTERGETLGRKREKTIMGDLRRDTYNRCFPHSPQKISALLTP